MFISTLNQLTTQLVFRFDLLDSRLGDANHFHKQHNQVKVMCSLVFSLVFSFMLPAASFVSDSMAETAGVYVYYNQADGKETYTWYYLDNKPA